MKRYQALCEDCGYDRTYTSEAKAAYALRQHSCELQRVRDARAARVAARQSVDEPKPCLHKRANHQHGAYARYVLDGCRCIPCREANRSYEEQRRKLHAYGRWNGLVDAEPAREHVKALMAAGMGLKRIGAVAGVSSGSLTKLIYGITESGGSYRPPAKRIKPENAERLLAVTLDLAPGAKIDGTGTRRRLQALVALGYPQEDLGRRLGIVNMSYVIHGRGDGKVTRATADAARRLYDELSMRLPRPVGRKATEAATRARNIARRHGWVPPLAWDDERIDDPAHRPDIGDRGRSHDAHLDHAAIERRIAGDRSVRLSKAEAAELARRWVASGRSPSECERITGVNARRHLGADRGVAS